MSKKITVKQLSLITFIESFQAENKGKSPTYAEMGKFLDKTLHVAFAMVSAVQRRGLVHKPFGRRRCIEIIRDEDELPRCAA